MPRVGDYDASGGSGTDFTSNVDCGWDENGQATSCEPGCSPGCVGGCDTTYVGNWHDDSITVQDMRERPEAVQRCPNCGHLQLMEYPGWGHYGEA